LDDDLGAVGGLFEVFDPEEDPPPALLAPPPKLPPVEDEGLEPAEGAAGLDEPPEGRAPPLEEGRDDPPADGRLPPPPERAPPLAPPRRCAKTFPGEQSTEIISSTDIHRTIGMVNSSLEERKCRGML
jgi:hypothetical protein